jgi:hypothetical protein
MPSTAPAVKGPRQVFSVGRLTRRQSHTDHFHLQRRVHQPALAGHAGGLVALIQPTVPGAVHRGRIGDIGQGDLYLQQGALIGAGLGQQGVDLGEDICGLAFGIQGRIIGESAQPGR